MSQTGRMVHLSSVLVFVCIGLTSATAFSLLIGPFASGANSSPLFLRSMWNPSSSMPRAAFPQTDVLLDAQFRCQKGREHCIPRCIINVNEAYETCLPIMNMLNQNLDIKEHGQVARQEIYYPDNTSARTQYQSAMAEVIQR